jgi:hypothetical protein
MNKVVKEVPYQFIVRVGFDYVKTALPYSGVPNWLSCQSLQALRDLIPSLVVHGLSQLSTKPHDHSRSCGNVGAGRGRLFARHPAANRIQVESYVLCRFQCSTHVLAKE